jgi:pimeloyl-ACP methyl ester carboxylesterase
MNEKASGGSLDVNGAAVYHEEHGDGAPLIVIHGGLSSSTAWEPVAPSSPMTNHTGQPGPWSLDESGWAARHHHRK